MDSKVKKQVVAVVTILLVFTVFAIFFANYIQTGSFIPSRGKKDNAQNHQVNETEEVVPEQDREEAPGELFVTQTEYGEYLLNLDESKDPNAFERDNDFFDKEIVTHHDRIEAAANEITLLATSVDKDLRVNVIDGNNRIVTGYPFEVAVKDDKGEETVYTDEDKDGTIYIERLSAGAYEAKLTEYGEYETMDTGITVSVRDEIEYRILDDITYLLKDESQVDAEKEDTQVKDALAEADSTEVTERLETDNTGFGIDVSKWNKEIDWEKVKAAGVDFAIIRCAYRGSSTGSLVEDPYFKKNIEGATKAGVKVGVYFFTQAVNITEAMEEASIAVALCRDYPISYPIFIDTEGAGANARAANLDVETRTAVCKTFCETVEAAGYNAGVYASKNWFNNNLEVAQLTDYYTWLAEYKSEATYEGSYDFWQYTSSGKVDGIEGRVDLNVGYVGF